MMEVSLTITRSTGPSAGRRSEMSGSASNCLCVGMNLSWFAWRRASMFLLGCYSMDCALHGESFQAGRVKTTSNGLGDIVEKASACRTALRTCSGSYSGFAMQDPVSR